MSKQDRQGARTPAELEQKYEFGKSMSDLEAVAEKQGEQLSRQKQTMNQFMSDSDTNFKTIEAGLARAEKNIFTLKTNVSSLSNRMTAAEKKDKVLDQKVSALIKSASSLEQNSSGVDKKLAALEKQLKTVEDTLADLVDRVTALEST